MLKETTEKDTEKGCGKNIATKSDKEIKIKETSRHIENERTDNANEITVEEMQVAVQEETRKNREHLDKIIETTSKISSSEKEESDTEEEVMLLEGGIE